jgi:hypothetical protein
MRVGRNTCPGGHARNPGARDSHADADTNAHTNNNTDTNAHTDANPYTRTHTNTYSYP